MGRGVRTACEGAGECLKSPDGCCGAPPVDAPALAPAAPVVLLPPAAGVSAPPPFTALHAVWSCGFLYAGSSSRFEYAPRASAKLAFPSSAAPARICIAPRSRRTAPRTGALHLSAPHLATAAFSFLMAAG